jgi:hypothetical protein
MDSRFPSSNPQPNLAVSPEQLTEAQTEVQLASQRGEHLRITFSNGGITMTENVKDPEDAGVYGAYWEETIFTNSPDYLIRGRRVDTPEQAVTIVAELSPEELRDIYGHHRVLVS